MFFKCVKGSKVTTERRNKSTTRKKDDFILLPIDNKNKLSYRNITNNNEDDDFELGLVKPTTENKKNLIPPIRRYTVKTRNRVTMS